MNHDPHTASSVETGHAPRHRVLDNFAGVLGLICLTVFTSATLPPGSASEVILVTLQVATMLVAFRASGVPRTRVRLAGGLSGVGLISLGIATAFQQMETGVLLFTVMMTALSAFAIGAIIARLTRQPVVDMKTVMGALSAYLLLGLLFATVYAGLQHVTGQFFVQVANPNPADFLYFSYTTLATVGYGDLTAASRLTRMISISEAIVGQLYLVTVVALVVANLGKPRHVEEEEQNGHGDAGPKSS